MALLGWHNKLRAHLRHRRSRETRPSRAPTAMFGIRAGYRHRVDNAVYDDIHMRDEYQREVYEAAVEIARRLDARTVIDVGCGSAYKLIRHFSHVHTIGFELPPTLARLNARYPDRDWRLADFGAGVGLAADMVICADVIEHTPDPDMLMKFIDDIDFQVLVLSTPDRMTMYGEDHGGPPENPTHCREWTMAEFAAYVGRWQTVKRQTITNRRQATQMLVCEKRQQAGGA